MKCLQCIVAASRQNAAVLICARLRRSAETPPRQIRGCRWITALTLLAVCCLLSPPIRAAEPQPPGGFRFAEVSDKSLGLWEGGQPVLVYNHGVISKAGVPADRARSSYVHPLYGLDGEVLTDDFPKDHYHHRGLFWSWPHVKIGDKEYDLWMLKGIRHQFERWLDKDATAKGATLAVENGWYVGAEKVVQEKVWLRVQPAKADERAIDVECEWTPLKEPLTLTGAEGKSYGGLTLRFAPGTNTAITIPAGLTREDLPMTNLPWADLTRLWNAEKKTSGAALFVHPSHPDFPPQWLTRHYGVLCLGWPGVKPATFPPGKAIRCRYRVWIHRDQVSAERVARAYEEYRR
ncbi:MAG: PmoA family protein [Akkermansiaceae bacterium]|nr:PmoA family protein [Akkermansiaceae bacterium]